MDDHPIMSPASASDRGNNAPVISLFLSLFLLILAFFILLVAISTFEDVKSQAVMDSLTSTFTTVLPTNSDPTEFTAKDGDIIAGQQFQDQVSDIFSTAMPVAKVEVVQPGKKMRAAFPIDSMFTHSSSDLRPVSIPLLDRIVAALSNPPSGLQFDMEFVVGANYLKDRKLPVHQTLALSRAGSFAREMAKRGAPPNSIAVGIEPADPKRAIIWFYVREKPPGSISGQ